MTQIFNSVFLICLLIGAFGIILNHKEFGSKLVGKTLFSAFLYSFINSINTKCNLGINDNLFGLIMILIVGVILFFKFKFIFKAIWFVITAYVKYCYKFGAWLTENGLLRFPIHLLPVVIKQIIMFSCFALSQCFIILALDICFNFSNISPFTDDGSWYWFLTISLVAILVLGNIGRYIYRKRESKGLANV